MVKTQRINPASIYTSIGTIIRDSTYLYIDSHVVYIMKNPKYHVGFTAWE